MADMSARETAMNQVMCKGYVPEQARLNEWEQCSVSAGCESGKKGRYDADAWG